MTVTLGARPADDPIWATDGLNTTEPIEAKKKLGWELGEEPPSAYFNWWQNNVYLWQQWLEAGVDALNAGKIDIDGDTIAAGNFAFQDCLIEINSAWTFWNVGRKALVHIANASTPYDDPTEGALGFFAPLTMQNVNTTTGSGGAHVSIDMVLGLLDPMGFRIDLFSDAVDEPVWQLSDYINGTLEPFARFDPAGGTAGFDANLVPINDGWDVGAPGTPWAESYARASKAKSHISYKRNPQPANDTELIEANQNKTIAAFGTIEDTTTTPAVAASGSPANNFFNISSVTKLGTGDYRITFNRGVGEFSAVSVLPRTNSLRCMSGFVEVGGASVRVRSIRSDTGAAADEDFSLLVVGLPFNIVTDPIS